MLIDWTDDFDRWLDDLEEKGGVALEWALALLAELRDLEEEPDQETATLKRIRQAKRYRLWRLAHPYEPDVAVRIIVWFASHDQAVVALKGFNKAALGDVWYDSATVQSEAMVDQWIRERGSTA
jgi:hypothetical protein